jgi:hypothetical protein
MRMGDSLPGIGRAPPVGWAPLFEVANTLPPKVRPKADQDVMTNSRRRAGVQIRKGWFNSISEISNPKFVQYEAALPATPAAPRGDQQQQVGKESQKKLQGPCFIPGARFCPKSLSQTLSCGGTEKTTLLR